MACCVGNVIGGFFERFATSHSASAGLQSPAADRLTLGPASTAKMGEILTAASAAGVAVAFGSPIGGVLFAIEVWAARLP